MKKMVRGLRMIMALSGVFVTGMLAACGGGNDSGNRQGRTSAVLAGGSGTGAASLSVPALIGIGNNRPADSFVLQQASCPNHLGKIAISDSTLKNLVFTLGSATQDQLMVRTGAGGLTNLTACLVKPTDSGYTAPPVAVHDLLQAAGATVQEHFIVNGDFSTLREVKLLLWHTLATNLGHDQAALYKIVSYTQNDAGAWERAVLDTTMNAAAADDFSAGARLSYQAVVTRGGYYTLEQ